MTEENRQTQTPTGQIEKVKVKSLIIRGWP